MNLLLDGEQTDRLSFRLVNQSDYHHWLPFFQHPETSKHWVEPKVEPGEACSQWFQKQFSRYKNNSGGMNALVHTQTGELIGYCGLLVQTVDQIKEIEIAYSLLPRFWNSGYASEAAKKCRDFAFEKRLTDSLISIISVSNKASERVALKNGLVLSKTTDYKENRVNIFRIDYDRWKMLQS